MYLRSQRRRQPHDGLIAVGVVLVKAPAAGAGVRAGRPRSFPVRPASIQTIVLSCAFVVGPARVAVIARGTGAFPLRLVRGPLIGIPARGPAEFAVRRISVRLAISHYGPPASLGTFPA